MSVLIKGMKMPQEQSLRMVLNPNGQLFVDHGVYFDEYEAVEVPTPHGRLFDANALISYRFRNPISYNAFVRLVERMPATIEAEEGEKHEID